MFLTSIWPDTPTLVLESIHLYNLTGRMVDYTLEAYREGEIRQYMEDRLQEIEANTNNPKYVVQSVIDYVKQQDAEVADIPIDPMRMTRNKNRQDKIPQKYLDSMICLILVWCVVSN